MRVTRSITVPEDELHETFIRAAGPGGQNVNKVATAVQLRFDAAGSPRLAEDVRQRLLRQAGQRATADGEIVIEAKRYRTRERNRQDARERLATLLRRAARSPKKRRATTPTAASRRRRLDEKRKHGRKKRLRRPPGPEE